MIELNRAIFREYDIRGLVGDDLSPEFYEQVGKGYGTYLHEQGVDNAVVGYDNRITSPDYAAGFISGLTSTGINVTNIGLVTSPMFYFARQHLGIMAGGMVTASHNPPEFNGLKLGGTGTGTLFGEAIQDIYERAMSDDYAQGEGSEQIIDVTADYYAMLEEKIQLGDRKLKVVVDCGNGTPSLTTPDVLKKWGVELIEMYCESDGTFPNHIADPTVPESTAELQKRVVEEGADMGLAFDGDGDRIGVVDEKGNMIYGDLLMILYWREIIQTHPGADAIVEIKCTQALWEELEKMGAKPQWYKTGHSYIKAKMKEIGAVFSGEMSGHMYFADEFFGYDDALYAAGRFLRILSNTDKQVSELLEGIPMYPSTPEVRVPAPDDQKTAIVEKVANYFKNETDYDIVDVDGVRVLFGDGWGLIRQSNTSPVIVVRAEAQTPERLEEIKSIIEEQLTKSDQVSAIDWSGGGH